ncbi:helix-turn-helix domain-containing protein [Actinokineospora globicatena]|uniref:HTH cro/C1-type domain-containing protein n=1 Tax=Actinokineospora globicatena TaxID=103729 RepID=A0A9W6V9Z8_9PSEU|nr:helix-turn-helix transcriptional regulator [Actinokineospora globicatena]GLW91473.1 hypothetical protein Aglo03_22890 [Actinokineospora globicatena]
MAGVDGDWDAVSQEIGRLMHAQGMNQAGLIAKSGISKVVVAELQHNKVQRTRTDHVLRALSDALGVHQEHLRAIAQGRVPQDVGEPPIRSDADIAGRLDALDYRMAELTEAVRRVAEMTEVLRRVERALFEGPPPTIDVRTPD